MNELSRIALPLIAGVVVLMVVMRWASALVRQKLYEQIRRQFTGQTIVRMSVGANFFGQKSKGMRQVRGNGALVLTQDQIYFALYLPRRNLVIPLGDVLSLSTPRAHLGRTVGVRLLSVDYRADGGEDAVAWAVTNVDQWISDIERYRRH